jgi:hypothetical protein
MGFFEEELQKIFGKNSPITDARFTGRACVGRLGEATSVKLEFISLRIADHYEALRATVLNRNEGVMDRNEFRFEEILGKKPGKAATQKDGILPHVWIYGDKAEWYAYQPAPADYQAIAEAVNSYLEVFVEPSPQHARGSAAPVPAWEKPSVLQKIRDAQTAPKKPRKAKSPDRKNRKKEMEGSL